MSQHKSELPHERESRKKARERKKLDKIIKRMYHLLYEKPRKKVSSTKRKTPEVPIVIRVEHKQTFREVMKKNELDMVIVSRMKPFSIKMVCHEPGCKRVVSFSSHSMTCKSVNRTNQVFCVRNVFSTQLSDVLTKGL